MSSSEIWGDAQVLSREYRNQVKQLADSYTRRSDDIYWQSGVMPGKATENKRYNPDEPFRTTPDFLHVNSQQPRKGFGLRCYISPDVVKNPAVVISAWGESIRNSSLRDRLYFKLYNSIQSSNDEADRADHIIIYKDISIDDVEFKDLLLDFQRRCNEVSPKILQNDETRMVVTARKIADGISIAGDPSYVNDYLMCTGRERHSWTTFIDKMILLSISVAANRLGLEEPRSIDESGLEQETKKVFREFMLLSKINPDTMLPVEYGDELPSWAKLVNSTD